MRELEIYIHIPFCVRKCGYCDFLSAPAKKEQRDRYVQTLLEEIRGGAPVSALPSFMRRAGSPNSRLVSEDDTYIVTSVFLGGGTPSLLLPSQIAEIMDALRARFHFSDRPEISIECNPGSFQHYFTCGKADRSVENMAEQIAMEAYLACGINRISFGLQSADDAELAALGRIHTFKAFLHSYESARAAGFTNINVDLMSALPGQSVTSWENTLRRVLSLSPEHISAYSLIIEEGTPFYEKYHGDDLLRADGEQPRFLPSEEDERQMVERTEQMLGRAGYVHYEISNYARPGYECRHNAGYWRGTEYMGFGLGASSLLRNIPITDEGTESIRCKNPTSHAEYERLVRSGMRTGMQSEMSISEKGQVMTSALASDEESFQILSVNDEMSEFMFLGLRMLSGVSEKEFSGRFGIPIDAVYGEPLERLISLKLLRRENGRIFLTQRGLDLSNPVMAEFLL